jgi:hypothetical protein
MDSADRDRALDRFVAGLPVGEAELAEAVAARAVDATIVVNALLRGLNDEAAIVRLRSSRRVAKMAELPPRLAVELRRLAAADTDRRVRAAAETALVAHEAADEPEHDLTYISRLVEAARRLGLGSLWVTPRRVRGQLAIQGSGARRIILTFYALDRAEAPATRVQLIAQDGAMRLELARVPQAFVGSRLAVIAHAGETQAATAVAVSTEPVDDAGFVTIAIPPALGTPEQIAQSLATELEIVVVDG